MKKICSYCGAHYGDTGAPPPPGVPRDAVTHGACASCFAGLMEEMDRLEDLKRLAAVERLASRGRRKSENGD